MLGLGRILISDLVVANLLMYSLPVMILLYLAASFFYTEDVLDEYTQRELYINANAYIKRTLSYRFIIHTYTLRVAGFVIYSYRL